MNSKKTDITVANEDNDFVAWFSNDPDDWNSFSDYESAIEKCVMEYNKVAVAHRYPLLRYTSETFFGDILNLSRLNTDAVPEMKSELERIKTLCLWRLNSNHPDNHDDIDDEEELETLSEEEQRLMDKISKYQTKSDKWWEKHYLSSGLLNIMNTPTKDKSLMTMAMNLESGDTEVASALCDAVKDNHLQHSYYADRYFDYSKGNAGCNQFNPFIINEQNSWYEVLELDLICFIFNCLPIRAARYVPLETKRVIKENRVLDCITCRVTDDFFASVKEIEEDINSRFSHLEEYWFDVTKGYMASIGRVNVN